jgi:glycosyltransferase involved in cell wall biosynthesis
MAMDSTETAKGGTPFLPLANLDGLYSSPNQMLKIVFFTAFSHTQGTYFRWHNLAVGLRKLGHDVFVHSVGPESGAHTWTEVRDGVFYQLVPLTPNFRKFLNPGLDPFTLLRSLRHAPPPADIYHIFQPFPHSCIPALFHRRNAKALFFDWDDLWWDGLYPSKHHFPLRDKLLTRFAQYFEATMPRKADGVTTCSRFLQNKASQNGSRNTHVIHNGIWPSHSYPTKSNARATLNLQPHAYYFGFMGRTIAELSWCIDVLTAPPPSDHPVRLALCGMRQQDIDSLPSDLLPFIDYLGNLTSEETRTFSRAIDCGLLPLEDNSFNQSRFPIKFAEYLAAGARVIASDVGEIADLARQFPQVTLAGASRQSWQDTLREQTLPSTQTRPIHASADLTDSLGWQTLTNRLLTTYADQIAGGHSRHSLLNYGE